MPAAQPTKTSCAADDQLRAILARLDDVRLACQVLKETLLANLVMVGEAPAPTFHEEQRARFVRDRFSECGLEDISTDETGNCAAIRPGSPGDRNILLVAHLDTAFAETVDHTITIQADRAVGPGIGDNSLGVATIVTLPTLLDALGIELKSNLVLMGAARSLGRGDLEGLHFFLDHCRIPIRAGIGIEGCQLGRLSYSSIGMVRGEISIDIPEQYDWTRFGAGGAVQLISEVINRIQQIPLPASPRTSIVLGAVHAGTSFNTTPTSANLRFEIRSESGETVDRVRNQVQLITEELTVHSHAQVTLQDIAHRAPGGVPFGHPLVTTTRNIMRSLAIEPRVAPSMSELTCFLRHNIPAITLGLTVGGNLDKTNEYIEINPTFTGLTQLVAVLLAIDEGLCDED